MLDARVMPGEKVLTKMIDGEIIALSLSSGHYYRLSPTASAIWGMVKKELTVSEIKAALVEKYDAPESEIECDLIELLQFLEKEKLIKVVRKGSGRRVTR